ncbi:hypothetical protein [Streptococcus suis]|uniref:hypothetical protein n=1 Tax=Streptococcus suis TaxID=1307 RepID=UPI001C571928|nr:hypothetical protein [Streptococcus suis]QXT27832.1 hypothetical protein KWY62_02420 [Streptococcus suis]
MSEISNIFTGLRTYIIQHEKLISWIIAPIIVGLVLLIVPAVFTNTKRYFGNVEITSKDFINVPGTVNGEALLSNNTDILEKYVQAKLVIENNKFESTIHKFALTEVTIENYQYVDLVIQNGFDNDTQMVEFYRFNNGTQQSDIQKYEVNIKYHNSINNNTSVIKSHSIDGKVLKSGNIELIYEVNLSSSEIKKHFDNSIPDYKQTIEISIHSSYEESKVVIPYLSSEGKFIRNLGGDGPPNDKTTVPILELVEPYKQDYSFTINQNLIEGKNYFKFNILVDKASLITYNIVLVDDKGNTIVSAKQKEPIKIRFPQYKLVSFYNDDIYHYMKANKLKGSDISEVKLRQLSLVNSIDKTKTEYDLLK